jgi:branched-chain amino acid transport system substrate-binding protein
VYALPIQDLAAIAASRLTRTWTTEECEQFLHTDRCPEGGPRLPEARGSNVAAPVPAALPAPASVPVFSVSSAAPNTIKIVSSMPRTGGSKGYVDAMVDAFKMALDELHNRASNFEITYEDLDDANPIAGEWDEQGEIANANPALSDPSVMVYLGTYNSGAAAVAIPLLCQGNLAMISPSNTDAGLTKKTPFNTPNEPEVHYPGCPRNYTRVVPTDDMQAVVAAGFAKQIGASRVYVLRDSSLYAQLLAQQFDQTAHAIDLQVVGGPDDTDSTGNDYRELAERVHQANPDLVYWSGNNIDDGVLLYRALRATLGNDVKLMGTDGIYSGYFIDSVGPGAEGTYVTSTTIDRVSMLSGAAADWARRYKERFGFEPFGYVPNAYEAMNVALAAIARVDKKDRAAIRDAIFATRDYDGLRGHWSFDPNGDTSLTSLSIAQVQNGRWNTVQIAVAPR